MKPSFVLNLNDVDFKVVGQVGGKAASLGEMLQTGITVPHGFVITTAALYAGMSKELEQTALKAFDRLGVRRVAVRSSAVAEDSKTASWTGQLESYLNVTRDELLPAIKKCWNSIKADRAQHYAREHHIDQDRQAVAVIVQAMVNSDISGVLFTINPVTQNRNELVIESVSGLGELLVQGEVTPESLVVNRDGIVVSRKPSRQRTKLVYKDGENKKVTMQPPSQVLGDKLLSQLVAVALKIERHYRAPQDIEWAVENGQLYVVQSRPITTINEAHANDENIAWLTTVARRHTPLFLSLAISGQDSECIKKQTGLPIGFAHMRRRGLAFQFDKDELAAARALVHDRVGRDGLSFFDGYSKQCFDSGEALLQTAESVGGSAAKTSSATFKKLLGSYFDAAVSHASNLLVMILVQFELEDFLKNFVSERIGDTDQAEHVIAALKMALEPTHEVVNLERLLELGQLVQTNVPNHKNWIAVDPHELTKNIPKAFPQIWQSIKQYEAEFGWMGRMYYAGSPLSATDIIIRLQNSLRHNCKERLRKIRADHKQQVAARAKAIADLGGKDAQQLADLVARYMYLRTYRLDVFFIAHEHVLGLLAQAAQSLGLDTTDDILYLDWREIMSGLEAGLDTDELRSKITERRQGFEMLTIAGKTEWFAAQPEKPTAETSDKATTLKGVTACAGVYQGRARLVLNDKAMLDMAAGEVLVTTMTTPSLMLAVEKAGAIVTDEGGMLCHAAIVSRELKIPCVISTEVATKVLNTGDKVVVDADYGTVTILAV